MRRSGASDIGPGDLHRRNENEHYKKYFVKMGVSSVVERHVLSQLLVHCPNQQARQMR